MKNCWQNTEECCFSYDCGMTRDVHCITSSIDIRTEQWQCQGGRGQSFVYNHVCSRSITRYFHH
ncbi:hypothetical protein E2C01_016413 [Portunus trituberculatus]|uniref:Uncharacterized protein n=1 Tax=Portunus trituberculatus TaxID=210409 RepID=A0A5B7DQI1_PORTR|nr:hypothetical protein [Portunus trituberculatus]